MDILQACLKKAHFDDVLFIATLVFSIQLYVPHPVLMAEHVIKQMYVNVHQAGQVLNVKQV